MNPLQIMQMVNQLKSNPASILSQFGVPQNMFDDPQNVIQFLMNSGKISQNQYDNAIRQAQMMGIKM